MTNLTELHQAAVVAAEALREAQARCATERAASEDGETASREARQAQKDTNKVYTRAMNAFQNAIDEVGVANVPNLKDLYAEIGEVKIYA